MTLMFGNKFEVKMIIQTRKGRERERVEVRNPVNPRRVLHRPGVRRSQRPSLPPSPPRRPGLGGRRQTRRWLFSRVHFGISHDPVVWPRDQIYSEIRNLAAFAGHMDILDQALDTSHDKGQDTDESVQLQEGDSGNPDEQTAVAIASVQQAGFGDHSIQYQFRTENNGGQVTYRVVQVSDGQLDGQSDSAGAVSVVSSTAFTGSQQAVAQAVIQNPFSNGGSPSTESVGGEARFTYFPASAVGDGATAVVSAQGDPSLAQGGGQFYVMMTPQDVLQTGSQRTIAPRTHTYSPKIDGPRTPRDERRRAQHNEVERRRRDKINNWIVQLSKIIPDCNADNTKTGQSKGGILSKACDYIRELRQTNQRMQESFKETERLQLDNDMLRQQV
ncbi:upstream stimulatory factor 2-like isoform X2 [Mobula hypostoma]|uniref:upstream stimulatory factor 2-like isoform X2 n=2 Tax=Mobula TaxID=86365 RepID=UPI002FC398B9